MAEALVQALIDGIERYGPLSEDSLALDLYCGVGLFSAFLAPRAGSLIGIEASPSAVDDFAVNLDEFDHVAIYEGAVEEVLPQLDLQPDLIVADPPRAGLERQALDAIVNLTPPLFAYISCDPATVSRDAKRLRAAGFRLLEITPFDVFPQTFHIESLSFWEPETRA